MKDAGLTPIATESGNIYFQEARLVLECKKLYSDYIKEANFIDTAPLKNYPLKDYHRMYIGEITSCLEKQL